MEEIQTITSLGRTIQLAVAPVFLIAGIGSMLGVVTARLGRVIDRARWIEERLHQLDEEQLRRASEELKTLDRRMVIAHRAVACCASSALCVCLVIALMFLADLTDHGWARLVAGMFIAAMGLIVTGMGFFLVEVRLAILTVRVRRELLPEQYR